MIHVWLFSVAVQIYGFKTLALSAAWDPPAVCGETLEERRTLFLTATESLSWRYRPTCPVVVWDWWSDRTSIELSGVELSVKGAFKSWRCKSRPSPLWERKRSDHWRLFQARIGEWKENRGELPTLTASEGNSRHKKRENGIWKMRDQGRRRRKENQPYTNKHQEGGLEQILDLCKSVKWF